MNLSLETVEINSSFYRLPFLNVVKGWARKATGDFRFTVKMWRRITHLKKLRGVEDSLKIFFERISPLRRNLVYVYFNNDYNAYAVTNALKLKELLK